MDEKRIKVWRAGQPNFTVFSMNGWFVQEDCICHSDYLLYSQSSAEPDVPLAQTKIGFFSKQAAQIRQKC